MGESGHARGGGGGLAWAEAGPSEGRGFPFSFFFQFFSYFLSYIHTRSVPVRCNRDI
jgi:hypothetical protein